MENGYVVSTNPQYKFRTTKDHNFLAFFRPINKAQVLVVDANNKYLGSLLIDFDSVLTSLDLDVFEDRIINRPGYEFEKWNISFPFLITKEVNIVKASYNPVNLNE